MMHKPVQSGRELYSSMYAAGQGRKLAHLSFVKSILYLSALWKVRAIEIPSVFLTRSHSNHIPQVYTRWQQQFTSTTQETSIRAKTTKISK